jgi:HD-GYP domain-containing protein (c-di-GMP phosphodiesterase class II)
MELVQPRLYHPPDWAPAQAVRAALATERVALESLQPGQVPDPGDAPAALLLPIAALESWPAAALALAADRGVALVVLGDGTSADIPASVPLHLCTTFVPAPQNTRHLTVALRTALREAGDRRSISTGIAERAALAREVTDLTETGIRLLTEREREVLLELILSQARRLTAADAASLYLVESDTSGPVRLVFSLTQNESRPDIRLSSFTLPLNSTSLAGYAAMSGEPLVLDDVYQLPASAPYRFNPAIDVSSGYRTKSMLVIPMPNQAGQVIGVLQLINRKPPECRVFRDAAEVEALALPFDARTVDLARALAGQAAVSIENAQLHDNIERLFEGFVLAAVAAIEQRDPATSGHSERVALMTCALAEAADRETTGRLADFRMGRREQRALRYAALLHDVGKIGVREQVLVKARKLYPGELQAIELRHALLRKIAEWRYQRELNRFLYERGREEFDATERGLRQQLQCTHARLDAGLALVQRANEPTVLPAGEVAGLEGLLEEQFEGPDGTLVPLLTPAEVAALRVRQGSLGEEEWAEIRNHAVWTWEFLNRIPWTPDLGSVAEIARGHHEKLDGSGYPNGVAGDDIPLLTRMMTIADIYDALTAADRPYKRAIAPSAAMDILQDEARQGRLDADLVRLFIEARIFERSPARRAQLRTATSLPRAADS